MMRRVNDATPDCPCGNPLNYDACCGRYHAGPEMGLAPDPVSLMRSRYTAFVKDLRPYLLRTWHPDHRPEAIEAPEPGLQWLGLQVKASRMRNDHEGLVTFVARYKINGKAYRLEECSEFLKSDGRWLYVRAQIDSGSTSTAQRIKPLLR
jgi:SEC-C motif domain protein